MQAKWDIDFSLALRNRTGKYFIGREVIEAAGPRIAHLRYGRFVFPNPPSGIGGKIVARLAGMEMRLRRKRSSFPFRVRPSRPVLHLDPYTAALYSVGPQDLVLCHDMGPITHPDLFAAPVTDLYRQAFGNIVNGCPRMVFVSHASQNAFTALYGALPRMDVIYPPLRAELSAALPEAVPDVAKRFLLTVGSVGARKNQLATIRAYGKTELHRQDVHYVLCGSREPGAEAVAAAAKETPGVLLLPYVTDGQLAWLYRHAMGFVLASRLEGFGVPVAEAIANGLVPVVSRDSVLEEVAGEGALTVDPHSEADIARGLMELVGLDVLDRDRRRHMLATSIESYSPVRFEASWQQVLAGDGIVDRSSRDPSIRSEDS